MSMSVLQHANGQVAGLQYDVDWMLEKGAYERTIQFLSGYSDMAWNGMCY